MRGKMARCTERRRSARHVQVIDECREVRRLNLGGSVTVLPAPLACPERAVDFRSGHDLPVRWG